MPIYENEKAPSVSGAYSQFCRGGQIRTDDLLVPNQARYRATLRPEQLIKARRYKNIFNNQLVIPAGVEPATCCLEGSCSIQLSYETKQL